jgi:hypothetical protein
MDFENTIHNKEIGQAALVRIRITVRSRSPLGPAANQTGFQVIAPHTANVKIVETAILVSFLKNEELV